MMQQLPMEDSSPAMYEKLLKTNHSESVTFDDAIAFKKGFEVFFLYYYFGICETIQAL